MVSSHVPPSFLPAGTTDGEEMGRPAAQIVWSSADAVYDPGAQRQEHRIAPLTYAPRKKPRTDVHSVASLESGNAEESGFWQPHRVASMNAISQNLATSLRAPYTSPESPTSLPKQAVGEGPRGGPSCHHRQLGFDSRGFTECFASQCKPFKR